MQKHPSATRCGVRTMRIGLTGALVVATLGLIGCAPRLIQDYSIRQPGAERCLNERPGRFVFAVQEGTAYQLGECDRKATGELTNCKMYEVEFDE